MAQPHTGHEGPVADAEVVAARISTDSDPMGRPGRPVDRRSPFLVGMAAAAGVLVTVAVVEVVIQLNRRDAQTACATLCKVCDARSFIYLLGSERLQQAVSAHAGHRPRASG